MVASAKMGFLPVPIAIRDLTVRGMMRLIIQVSPENYVEVAQVSFLGKPFVDVTIKPLKVRQRATALFVCGARLTGHSSAA